MATGQTLAWRLLVPFGIGFLLTNYYRSVNAVLSPHLIADLGLTAGDLGLMTSVYFVANAVTQIPLGLAMDRYGPRRVQAALLALATIGMLMFALGENRAVLVLGRILLGIGAAGGLMTAFQAVQLFYPATRWAVLNGWILTAGGLGMLAASLPTELLLHFTDWRHILAGVALISGLLGVVIFAVVPETELGAAGDSFAQQLRGMAQVFRDRAFWRIAPLFATTFGASMSFQGLWAGPWLKDVAALTPGGVASGLLFLGILYTASYAGIGTLADWCRRRGIGLITLVAAGTLVFMLSQLPLLLPSGTGRFVALAGMGGLSNFCTLCFPLVALRFSAALAGRVATIVNLAAFVGAFAIQYAIGAVLDLFLPLAPGRYPAIAYQTAFAAMLALEIASWLWFLVPPKPAKGS
jgi:MFS family permease